MKDALKGFPLSLLIRGGFILPLLFSIAIHETHPQANAYWFETIAASAALTMIMLWLLYDMKRSDREYDEAKNDAQNLNVGDRLVWKRDRGTIVEKGRHYVVVKWDNGKHYAPRLNRVWSHEKTR